MAGDDAREHGFTSMWLKYVLPGAAFMAVWLGVVVHGLLTDPSPMLRLFLAVGAATIAAFAWVVVRKLVRRASFDGRHLRASTLLRRHEVDAADLTGVSWNAAGGAARVWPLPLGGATARVRHRGGELLIPMPAGTELVQRLERAAPPEQGRTGGPADAGGAREVDVRGSASGLQLAIAGITVPWIVGVIVTTSFGKPVPLGLWGLLAASVVVAALGIRHARTRTVGRAVIDGEHLRVTTVDGREHDLELSRLELPRVGVLDRLNNGIKFLHHPGGSLWVPMPGGAELVDRLDHAGAGR